MTKPRRGRPRNEEAREQIVRSAAELFVQEGYSATRLGDIARDAGVSVQTIYSAFGSKTGLLSAAHDVALVGDGEPVALQDRPWFGELLGRGDLEDAVAHAVAHVLASTERVAAIYTVIQSASADPAVSALLGELHAQRRRFSLVLASRLIEVRGDAAGGDRRRVADVLYAVLCVETYTLFVTECGWSVRRWRDWATQTVARELLPL